MAPTVHTTDPMEQIDVGLYLLPPKTTSESKGRKTSKKAKATTADTTSSNDTLRRECDGFQRLYVGRESEAFCRRRHALFKRRWGCMKERIDSILERLNLQAIEQIVNFVRHAHDGGLGLHNPELPTGLIFTGINPHDHERLFTQIAGKLREERASAHSAAVAMLPAAKCTNLKAASRCLIEQFLGAENLLDDEESNEMNVAQETPESTKKCTAKLPNYDLQRLTGWHRLTGGTKTLIVVLPDFECFDVGVLHALIGILSTFHKTIPFVLLFGVATSIETVHQTLSRDDLACLRIEKFKSQQAQECVNVIVQELIVKQPVNVGGVPTAFKLGLEPYRFLVDNFQLHTLSVSSFEQALKYAMMDMYYSSPLCVLMDARSDAPEADVEDDITALSEDHLRDVRMTKSFRRFVDSNLESNPDLAAAVLCDDNSLKQWIRRSLLDLDRFHVRYHAGIQCVVELQNTINSPTFRRTIRNLHLLGLQGDIVETEFMVALLQLLRKKKVAVMQEFLVACLKQLTANAVTQAAFSDEIATINALQIELASFVTSGSDSDDSSGDSDGAADLARSGKRLRPAGRTTNVAKRLKPIVEHVKAGTLQACSKRVTDFLEELFRDCLKSYTEMPLHEPLYYANEGRLKKAFHPQPRAAIQTALGQTQHYLSCTCCPSTNSTATAAGDAISANLQDTSIAYRLYLECGRLINLYDWFVAFGAILEKEKDDGLEGDEGEEDAAHRRQHIQARFVKAIAELQYMGFIKSTTRKTDHVMRLTWGNV
ncbi:hypothetical protein PhCBS80983_g01183 [Powellomyces hirtus]|uniref:Origin recognition complex subunit 3 n=1 Tax=Powellomyces hirtus TaxID=109895 RepID=A0A507EB85_9FUNG|nr:hypothetical protein PhCBS80983_g01183 [Powellomyces hirtus]